LPTRALKEAEAEDRLSPAEGDGPLLWQFTHP